MSTTTSWSRPRVGISACLTGAEVRYDGGHKWDSFCANLLAPVVELVPVCPEVEAGLGIPRPPIHIAHTDAGPRLLDTRDHRIDLTDTITAIADQRAAELGDISGFILKRRSPSCGIEQVPIFTAPNHPPDHRGVGLFALRFGQLRPLVPLEDERRLNDPGLRANFLERMFALDRWYRLAPNDISGFIAFHTEHKLMLMARGSGYYTRLGRIITRVTRAELKLCREHYIHEFMPILGRMPSRRRQEKLLQHALGYLKRELDGAQKRELLTLFEDYRSERVPLSMPLRLLRRHLRKHPGNHLNGQHYFQPYPEPLGSQAGD